MKKLLYFTYIMLTVVLLTQLVFAAYPYSLEQGIDPPEEGQLMEGEFFGTQSFSHSDADSFERAWDGDPHTFYDPTNAATTDCYTGMMMEEPYVLTEIRLLPREGWLDRYQGAEIQGSVDGEEWVTIYRSKKAASDWRFFKILPRAFETDPEEAFTMFRYVNLHTHGDIGEIELYGYPVSSIVDEEAIAKAESESESLRLLMEEREQIAQHVITSPSSGDMMNVIIILICVSGGAMVLMYVLSLYQKTKKK
ncbi:MAG: discoidin domain-containing protein [Clostridia bacterium]|nr:discoidin domain-containing protein [Clostridia bacterium]